MKILLDECIPRSFKEEIKNHSVKTVPEMGWAGKKNGELLRLIESEFEIFITVDRNLYFQQPMKNLKFAVIVLVAPTNRLKDLKQLTQKLIVELETTQAGKVIEVI